MQNTSYNHVQYTINCIKEDKIKERAENVEKND